MSSLFMKTVSVRVPVIIVVTQWAGWLVPHSLSSSVRRKGSVRRSLLERKGRWRKFLCNYITFSFFVTTLLIKSFFKHWRRVTLFQLRHESHTKKTWWKRQWLQISLTLLLYKEAFYMVIYFSFFTLAFWRRNKAFLHEQDRIRGEISIEECSHDRRCFGHWFFMLFIFKERCYYGWCDSGIFVIKVWRKGFHQCIISCQWPLSLQQNYIN